MDTIRVLCYESTIWRFLLSSLRLNSREESGVARQVGYLVAVIGVKIW
jgi:hypothetical protein